MPYSMIHNHQGCPAETPYAVVKSSDGELIGSHATADDALAQISALYAEEAATDVPVEDAAGPSNAGQPWRAPVLALLNTPTDDGRVFDEIEFRELPLSLLWQPANEEGHGGAVVCGRIDEITQDGDTFSATGMFDDSPVGWEVVRLRREDMLRGISIDAAILDLTVSDDGMMHFKAKIGAATVVPFPAFADAAFELVEPATATVDEPVDEPVLMAGDTYDLSDSGLGISLVAAGTAPFRPPRSWFDPPEVGRRTGYHVEENGRVWGHIYGWGECHTGSPSGQCITVARGGTYDYIVGVDGRGVICDDGAFVQTGPVCLSADHYDVRDPSWVRAKDHYANTALAVADVRCGEDEFGIWVAGCIRPGTSDDLIHALRASGPSPDWRPIAGRREMVAILAVNMQGFPALAASMSGTEMGGLVIKSAAADGDCGCGGHSAVSEALDRLALLEAQFAPYLAGMAAKRAEEATAIVAEFGLDDESIAAAIEHELLGT